MEQNAVDDAEYRCCRADSQGKGKDGNGRKARALRQRPQTISNILPQTGHRLISRRSDRSYNLLKDLVQALSREDRGYTPAEKAVRTCKNEFFELNDVL
jgi:hypothetical protein